MQPPISCPLCCWLLPAHPSAAAASALTAAAAQIMLLTWKQALDAVGPQPVQARHALQSGKERAHGSYSCLRPCLSARDGREALCAHFLLSRAALTGKIGAYVMVHLHEQLLRVKPACADRLQWSGTCAQHQCKRYHSARTDDHGRRGWQAREFVIPESERAAYRGTFSRSAPAIRRRVRPRPSRKKAANAWQKSTSLRWCPNSTAEMRRSVRRES